MAGPPGLAYKGYFQFGRDAAGAWGSDSTTVDHRLRHVTITPEFGSDVIQSDVMDGTALPVAMYLGRKNVAFTIEFELTYTGMLILIDCLQGTATFGSNGGTTGGSFTHTFVFRDLVNSLKCQLGIGDIPAGQCEEALGCKIVEATFSGTAHERVRCTLRLVGKDHQTDQTPTGSLTAPTQDCVLMDHLSAFNDGIGSTGTVVGFELSIRANCVPRDYAAATIEEPLRGGFRDVTLTIREEFQSNAALEAQIALTSGAPSLTFTSGTKSIAFTLPAAYQTETVRREPEGQGRIIQPLVWKPIASSGNDLSIVVVNSQASITA